MIVNVNPSFVEVVVSSVGVAAEGRSVTGPTDAEGSGEPAPFTFVAVTWTFRYLPMSSSVSVYVEVLAPEMLEYEPPAVAALVH